MNDFAVSMAMFGPWKVGASSASNGNLTDPFKRCARSAERLPICRGG
jgi:hypothetical protein